MAKIATFMLCDAINHISTEKGPVPQLIAPQFILTPMFIPSNFSFGVSIGISGLDLRQVNTVKFAIKTPQKTIVKESEAFSIPASTENNILPQEQHGITLNIDVRNLKVEEEGIYSIIIFINGEAIGEKEIPIYRGENNA